MNAVKLITQDRLLYAAAFLLAAVLIYLLLTFLCAYHSHIVIRNKYTFLKFLFDRKGRLDIYILGFFLIASTGVLGKFLYLLINKINLLKNIMSKISFCIYNFINSIANKIIAFTQHTNLNTSLIFGMSYLTITILGSFLSVFYILPFEKNIYIYGLLLLHK